MLYYRSKRSQFGGMIIGLDKKFFRTFPTGFAVRMMVKATVPVNEQRAFVEKKREHILLWIIDEIMRTPVLLKKIGDLEYFKPTEVILLQNNEMEVLAPAGLIRACRGVLHLQCFCPGLNLSHLFFVLILIA